MDNKPKSKRKIEKKTIDGKKMARYEGDNVWQPEKEVV